MPGEIGGAYQRLTRQLWSSQRLSYVVPMGVLNMVRNAFPMFRGFAQQDSQEFLRCLMDQLHEDLKQPIYPWEGRDQHLEVEPEQSSRYDARSVTPDKEEVSSLSSEDSTSSSNYATCDSGWSSETGESPNHDSLRRPPLRNPSRRRNTPSSAQHSTSRDRESDDEGQGRVPTRRSGQRRSQNQVGTSEQKIVYKKIPVDYRSVISDIFDGKILSSVQCLTCNKVSETKETFQDLSLPLPSRDQYAKLSHSQGGQDSQGGWGYWLFGWFRSFLWGPSIQLGDCLSAFFSKDELKGDDMYSCENCKKLRNGVKYCKLLTLPEVLCVHLKRFRHDFSFSSKLSQYVSFPMEDLDLKPYLHRKNSSQTTTYDLFAVICHYGNAGGGHYTSYGLNYINHRWYEFDDQCVTEVDANVVENCEAYVLFYRKSPKKAEAIRQEVVQRLNQEHKKGNLMKFYVSREWIHRFNTFADPGPITNYDFLCPHGSILPTKVSYISDLYAEVPSSVWKYLVSEFGGGPMCTHLYHCLPCQQEFLHLNVRRKKEKDIFVRLEANFRAQRAPDTIYAIALPWYNEWEAFVLNKRYEPPGQVDNTSLLIKRNDTLTLRTNADYAYISRDMWELFYVTYGGGPEIMFPVNPTAAAMAANPTVHHSAAPPSRVGHNGPVYAISLRPGIRQQQQQAQQQQQQHVAAESRSLSNSPATSESELLAVAPTSEMGPRQGVRQARDDDVDDDDDDNESGRVTDGNNESDLYMHQESRVSPARHGYMTENDIVAGRVTSTDNVKIEEWVETHTGGTKIGGPEDPNSMISEVGSTVDDNSVDNIRYVEQNIETAGYVTGELIGGEESDLREFGVSQVPMQMDTYPTLVDDIEDNNVECDYDKMEASLSGQGSDESPSTACSWERPHTDSVTNATMSDRSRMSVNDDSSPTSVSTAMSHRGDVSLNDDSSSVATATEVEMLSVGDTSSVASGTLASESGICSDISASLSSQLSNRKRSESSDDSGGERDSMTDEVPKCHKIKQQQQQQQTMSGIKTRSMGKRGTGARRRRGSSRK